MVLHSFKSCLRFVGGLLLQKCLIMVPRGNKASQTVIFQLLQTKIYTSNKKERPPSNIEMIYFSTIRYMCFTLMNSCVNLSFSLRPVKILYAICHIFMKFFSRRIWVRFTSEKNIYRATEQSLRVDSKNHGKFWSETWYK